jgi:hypothetical protein
MGIVGDTFRLTVTRHPLIRKWRQSKFDTSGNPDGKPPYCDPFSVPRSGVPMDEAGRLSDYRCECNCHVVFTPKCRSNTLYGREKWVQTPISSDLCCCPVLIGSFSRPTCPVQQFLHAYIQNFQPHSPAIPQFLVGGRWVEHPVFRLDGAVEDIGHDHASETRFRGRSMRRYDLPISYLLIRPRHEDR